MLYSTLYSDSARSKGISDSYLNVFPSEATVGEVLDDFFADGKWDNYEQNGVYNPYDLYNNDPDIHRVVDQLVDGT